VNLRFADAFGCTFLMRAARAGNELLVAALLHQTEDDDDDDGDSSDGDSSDGDDNGGGSGGGGGGGDDGAVQRRERRAEQGERRARRAWLRAGRRRARAEWAAALDGPREGSPRGLGALHLAALGGHARVSARLLRAGAAPDAAAVDGSTALTLACERVSPPLTNVKTPSTIHKLTSQAQYVLACSALEAMATETPKLRLLLPAC